MSFAITIELDDTDLKHFTGAMRRAQEQTAHLSAQAITDAAGKLLAEGHRSPLPDFIARRLEQLDEMIALVHDKGFALPDEGRTRVLACLAYFSDPQDLIPDSVPVLGYLDDAIMIELCVQELAPELDAYRDFVAYRNEEAAARGVDPATLKTQRHEWAEARRIELLDRMRQRRGMSYQASSGLHLFSIGR